MGEFKRKCRQKNDLAIEYQTLNKKIKRVPVFENQG
jgi:hypothetical protein